jgi:hypothetical protein
MSLKIPRRIASLHPREMCPRPPVFPGSERVCLRGQAFEHTPIDAMAEQPKDTDDVAGAARPAVGGTGGLPSDDEALASDGASGGDGEYGLEPPPEPGPEASAPAPPQVAELAAACVRFVRTRFGVTLDFEPDTLSFVDHWVREARTELKERPELAELVQSAAGAYLGEVIRRDYGAFWSVEGERADWRLLLSTVFCAFNPIGMAREALLLDEAEGWHAHFELDPGEKDAIEGRLAALPSVTKDEYFAPSTRYDVVSIVVDALRARMRESGLDDVRFTPDDYR